MIDMDFLKGAGMVFLSLLMISILPITLELKARKHYKESNL